MVATYDGMLAVRRTFTANVGDVTSASFIKEEIPISSGEAQSASQ
jgi:hypothetical protein